MNFTPVNGATVAHIPRFDAIVTYDEAYGQWRWRCTGGKEGRAATEAEAQEVAASHREYVSRAECDRAVAEAVRAERERCRQIAIRVAYFVDCGDYTTDEQAQFGEDVANEIAARIADPSLNTPPDALAPALDAANAIPDPSTPSERESQQAGKSDASEDAALNAIADERKDGPMQHERTAPCRLR